MTRSRSALWLPIFDELADPGFFPVNLDHPDQLADVVTTITGLRDGPVDTDRIR
jgi:hypothetical protein